jgi:hypothetical protein
LQSIHFRHFTGKVLILKEKPRRFGRGFSFYFDYSGLGGTNTQVYVTDYAMDISFWA